MINWLRSRRRRRVKLLEADAQLAKAEGDLEDAKGAQREAREVAAWAAKVSAANRFDLRLTAAYRLQAGKHN